METCCSQVVVYRDVATFKKLYKKVRNLKNCIFYTDPWDAFAKVLPPDRHVISKSGTTPIEQDNSNTRHHLARMTRKPKVVSKKVFIVYESIKLWAAISQTHLFSLYQKKFISIFR